MILKTKTTIILLAWLVTSLLLPALAQAPLWALSTASTQLAALIDPQLPKATAHADIKALIGAAARARLDFSVISIEPTNSPDWIPSKPIAMNDFRPKGIEKIFKDSSSNQEDSERVARLDSAMNEFDAWYATIAGEGGGCARTKYAGDRLSRGNFRIAVVLLARDVCSTPRTVVNLQNNRRLAVALINGREDEDDCRLVSREGHARIVFPKSSMLDTFDAHTLDMLITGTEEAPAGRVTTSGCKAPSRVQASAASTLTSTTSSQPGSDETDSRTSPAVPPGGDGPRIVFPHNHSNVGAFTSFEGKGFLPGEIVWPIVYINGAHWVDAPSRARSDGTVDGTGVVIGLPQQACGSVYELRLISQLHGQPPVAGSALGQLPDGNATLPIELVRNRECQKAGL